MSDAITAWEVVLTVGSTTIMEAKRSIDRLRGMIEGCYQEMTSKMAVLELRESKLSDGISINHQQESDTCSVRTIKAAPSEFSKPELGPTTSRDILTFDFTEVLRRSWVYRRNKALDVSCCSLYSRDTCSMSWSCLSAVS